MSLSIGIELSGTERIVGKLDRAAKNCSDFRDALRDVAETLSVKIGREQFETEGSARGRPWAPLHPKTVRAREKRYGYYRRPPRGIPRILHWAGGLRASFENRSHGLHLERIDRHELEWGSKLPRRPFKEPDRPILAFRSDAERREFTVEKIRKHVMRAFGGV